MALLNQIQCATLYPNSGRGLCGYIPFPKLFPVFVPKGYVITAALAADIKTAFQNLLINNARTARGFAFGPVAEMTDSGQDVNRETLPSGAEFITREKTGVWKFDLVGGTFCVQKNLLQFDHTGGQYDVFFIDTNFVLVGQVATDDTGAFAVGGYSPYDIYVHAMTDPTYEATVRYSFELKFLNPKADQATLAVIDLKNAVTPVNWPALLDTYSVQNVYIQDVSPSGHAAGVFTVAPYGSCGNDNLATRFQTAMATASSFVVTNASTGAAITVTSVALNATKTAVVFTLDTTDTDYPTSGGKISIQMASVSALAGGTQPMKYYESLPFTVTV